MEERPTSRRLAVCGRSGINLGRFGPLFGCLGPWQPHHTGWSRVTVGTSSIRRCCRRDRSRHTGAALGIAGEAPGTLQGDASASKGRATESRDWATVYRRNTPADTAIPIPNIIGMADYVGADAGDRHVAGLRGACCAGRRCRNCCAHCRHTHRQDQKKARHGKDSLCVHLSPPFSDLMVGV